MKSFKNIILALCGASVILTGCYNLDLYPADQVSVNFDNEQQAYEALTGMYESLNGSRCYAGMYSYEALTDLGWSFNGWWASYDKYNLSIGTANASWGEFKDAWTGRYEGISLANNFISHMRNTTIDAAKVKQYVAEARFVRALMYSDLLNLFGGVPIYDDTFTGSASEMLYPRSTVEETRAFIISDLDAAIADLPKTRRAVGAAYQASAYALRGKVYLYAGQYEKAKEDFLKVVNGGYSISLNGSYEALFRPSGYLDGADDCSEILFAVEHQGGASTPYGFSVQFLGNRASCGGCINCVTPSKELADMYECIDGKPYNRDDFFSGISDNDLYRCKFDDKGQYVTEYPPKVDLLKDMYTKRDPRMNSTLILPYTMYEGFVNNENKDVEMVVAQEGEYHSNETYGYVRNAYNKDTYLWRKFVQEYDWGGQMSDRSHSPVNWPIIRYADVLLMLAECYCQLDDQNNAVAYINQVRSRVGMPGINSGASWLAATTKDEVMKRIKHERAVEFALEGIRYFDLVRWGDLVKATDGMVESDIFGNKVNVVKSIPSHYTLWAIPQSEIDLNPDLVQNPGW